MVMLKHAWVRGKLPGSWSWCRAAPGNFVRCCRPLPCPPSCLFTTRPITG